MPERTPEEREAARLERERRRRGGAGEPIGSRAPVSPPAPEVTPPAEPVPSEPAPDSFGTEELAEPFGDGDEPGSGDTEVASGTRRVGWRERTGAATAPPRPPRRPAGTGVGAGFFGSRRRLVFRGLAVLALLFAAAVIWFCVELFQPFSGSGHGSVTVTIPPRSSTSAIGNLLVHDGVVPSGFFFELRAALGGDRGKLRAGTYHLKLDMSYSDALKVLTTAPPAAKVSNVTIVPGRTRAQLSARLRAERISGSYLAATRRSPLLDPAAFGAPRGTNSLEGFLYPDTYQLRDPISISTLVADQLTQFRKQFATVSLGYARSKHLSAYDVLIIASIVEKEAGDVHDMPLVASVIYNRLHDHIPLGMDSTTRYEFNDYTTPLTQSQLASPSPYNTRLHAGLPPTPISNPSIAAIRAAAHPPQTNYLYFVVKPCGNGASVFTSTYSQFLADSARYQQARSAHGGNSPTKC